MPQTMTQCFKNLHTVTSSRLALNLMWNTNTSGKFTNNHIHLYFTVFCSHRCLAHIINLATQAVIARCSKAKYYNSNMDHDELPKDLGAADQDEIGIIHAICVKVCHLLGPVQCTICKTVCWPNFFLCPDHAPWCILTIWCTLCHGVGAETPWCIPSKMENTFLVFWILKSLLQCCPKVTVTMIMNRYYLSLVICVLTIEFVLTLSKQILFVCE